MLRSHVPTAAVLLAVPLLLLSSCYPAHLSTACQERISRCLVTCPGRDGTAPDRARETGLPTVDARTECERECHQVCTGESNTPTAFPRPEEVLPEPTEPPSSGEGK